jgi:hypothetical protein
LPLLLKAKATAYGMRFCPLGAFSVILPLSSFVLPFAFAFFLFEEEYEYPGADTTLVRT